MTDALTVLAEGLDDLSEVVRSHEAILEALTRPKEQCERPHVIDWTSLSPEQYEADLIALARWVYGYLRVVRVEVRDKIRPCWWEHLNVVDELSVLHKTWEHAYRFDKAIPSAADEWLDRWLPNALDRIMTFTAMCDKEQSRKTFHTQLITSPELPPDFEVGVRQAAITRSSLDGWMKKEAS